jgi:hypothetical protein
MPSVKRTARVAGWLYLLVTILGVVDLMVLPGKLFVRGDATATASAILAHEPLFRFYIASGLASLFIFFALGLALHRLLKEVDPGLAALMVILVAMQVPIGCLDEATHLMAFEVLRGGGYLAVFDPSHQDAVAMLFLHLSNHITTVLEALWGLWLFPLGWLVIRSRMLPRFLGAWLILNGFAYLALSAVGILCPQHADLASTICFPIQLGEVAFMLWLVIMGAKPGQLVAAGNPS